MNVNYCWTDTFFTEKKKKERNVLLSNIQKSKKVAISFEMRVECEIY